MSYMERLYCQYCELEVACKPVFVVNQELMNTECVECGMRGPGVARADYAVNDDDAQEQMIKDALEKWNNMQRLLRAGARVIS